ncbi:stalk domain-containing protein [Paenibacillus sp. YYML68]
MIEYQSRLLNIRFVSEALGAKVQWDDESRIVIFTP